MYLYVYMCVGASVSLFDGSWRLGSGANLICAQRLAFTKMQLVQICLNVYIYRIYVYVSVCVYAHMYIALSK